MKLTVPPLEIHENEGFSEGKDIFGRRGFGERLANLIENTDGELVIALDAPWGEGKSTFIKMWQGHLKQKDNGVHTIYFDAFENDHQSAPFLALAGEIYNLIGKRKKAVKSQFEQKTVAAFNTGGRIGLDLAARFISGGTLNGEILKDHAKDAFGNEAHVAMDNMDKYVSNSLKSVSANKKSIQEFKKYLQHLPPKLSYNGKSIVFIIDELDRCKPPFALEIVEVVKHLFAVPNITFVLVMNRSQLEASVKNAYGTTDASKYLHKFINLWVSLPKNKEPERSDTQIYLSSCIKAMGVDTEIANEKEWENMFKELSIYYDLSLRDIERCLTNFAFIRNGLDIELRFVYKWIASYLSIIKVIHSDVYKKLIASKLIFPQLFEQTNLDTLSTEWTAPGETVIESHPLKFILRYYLTDTTKRKLLFTNESSFTRSDFRGEPIYEVSRWLDSFRIN